MKNLSNFQNLIVIVGVSILTLVYWYQYVEMENLKEENKILKSQNLLEAGDIEKAATIDSLQYLIDSLQAELWPLEVELSRYETAYQIFIKRNPKAAEQYGSIISDETE